jgi:hypoxanthine phosphoribosyltransferase
VNSVPADPGVDAGRAGLTTAGAPSTASPGPAFAHASEAEFARILDFYEVRWLYEPHTFPILWSLEGAVVESFSPDFWLPDLETYVELTTLKQSLVRKKNRKLRRLRELYPDVRVKLFYGRDFRALMLKYGKLGLIDEMSGTLGQATPPSRPTRARNGTPDRPQAPAAAAGRNPLPGALPTAPLRRRRRSAGASSEPAAATPRDS